MSLGDYWRRLLQLALLLLVLAAPAAAHASQPQPETPRGIPAHSQAQHDHCVAAATLSADPFANLDTAAWQCGDPRHSLRPERSILRFTLDQSALPPTLLVTRRSPMQTLHIEARDADGTVRRVSYNYDALQPAMLGGFFKAALPQITDQTRTITAAFDLPTHVMTLEQAHLAVQDPGDHAQGRGLMLFLCALCGMLIMPMVFNAAFYRILREPFVLWHTALAISLMLTILFNSGLTLFIADLSSTTISRWTTLVFGLSVASGGMFAHSFVEPGKMHPALRGALPFAALWSLMVSFVHANFPFVGRVWQTDVYYALYLPVLCLYIVLLVDALHRGSRAAKFQLVGWLPLILVGIVRIASQFLPGVTPTDAMSLFYIGCVFEVLATTLGVTDRFMTMKDQRDRARTEAQMLERLTERDSLTGLNNRRVLEDRFDLLRAQGFTALAVLDLDHFKSVNDTFGHHIGDDVLRAVAKALQPDADTIVIRMGGEEFALLLRGDNAHERAEQRRQAVPRVVAESVRLDRLITASVGLFDAPAGTIADAAFEDLYRRADTLLYEAKNTGRNRLVAERLQAFRQRRRDRRKGLAA